MAKSSRKDHSVGSVLIAVALIISVFSIGFWTENDNLIINNDENKISGAVTGMEGVSGLK